MTEYKLYPNLPLALPEAPPQVGYDLNVVLAKRRGLIDEEKMFKKKYKKYNRILNRLKWLNACSSGISIATGISSVATFATFIGILVSRALGAASMTGSVSSGIISVLTKKYQQKRKKVMCLIDIVTPALVIFERVASGALKNGVINEEEFNMLQTLHLKTLNELTGIDSRIVTHLIDIVNSSFSCIWESHIWSIEKWRNQWRRVQHASDFTPWNFKRIDWYWSHDGSRAQIPSWKMPIGRDKRAKKGSRHKSLIACSLCYFMCYFKNG